jgi:hypothetical protein
VDHLIKRIDNFIKYRSNITPIKFGDFITDAEKNPERYKQGFWAVNCSLDQFPTYTLTQIIKKHNFQTNCVFLTSCHKIVEQYRDLNFRYFPYFIAEGIAQLKVANEFENPSISFETRKNMLTCVNRFARFHRLYVFYKLCQQPNLSNMKVSFTFLETRFADENGYVLPVKITLDEMLRVSKKHRYHTDHFESWLRGEFPNLPRQIEQHDNLDNKYDNWIKSEAFSESYANIVTETYVEDFLPTEKVVKPLIAGCLFMPTASKHYMLKLERMGFDLKFEGIDYTLYDNLPSWKERTDQVINMANELYPNIKEVWHNNIARLKYNRSLFFSKSLEDHVLQDVHDIFELNY